MFFINLKIISNKKRKIEVEKMSQSEKIGRKIAKTPKKKKKKKKKKMLAQNRPSMKKKNE